MAVRVVTKPDVHFHLVVHKVIDPTHEGLLEQVGEDQAKAEGGCRLKGIMGVAFPNHRKRNDALRAHLNQSAQGDPE